MKLDLRFRAAEEEKRVDNGIRGLKHLRSNDCFLIVFLWRGLNPEGDDEFQPPEDWRIVRPGVGNADKSATCQS